MNGDAPNGGHVLAGVAKRRAHLHPEPAVYGPVRHAQTEAEKKKKEQEEKDRFHTR